MMAQTFLLNYCVSQGSGKVSRLSSIDTLHFLNIKPQLLWILKFWAYTSNRFLAWCKTLFERSKPRARSWERARSREGSEEHQNSSVFNFKNSSRKLGRIRIVALSTCQNDQQFQILVYLGRQSLRNRYLILEEWKVTWLVLYIWKGKKKGGRKTIQLLWGRKSTDLLLSIILQGTGYLFKRKLRFVEIMAECFEKGVK